MKKKQVKPTLEENVQDMKKWMKFLLKEDNTVGVGDTSIPPAYRESFGESSEMTQPGREESEMSGYMDMAENDKDDLYTYEVPTWALSALINGDYSALSDEDELKVNDFVKKVAAECGNAHFIYDSEDQNDDMGFRHGNDLDKMGADVVKVYIRPDKPHNVPGENEVPDKYDTHTKNFDDMESGAVHEEEPYQFAKTVDDLTGGGPHGEKTKPYTRYAVPNKPTATNHEPQPGKPNYRFADNNGEDNIDEEGGDELAASDRGINSNGWAQGEKDNGGGYEVDQNEESDNLDDMPVSLKMAIMSHCSDIGEQHPDLRGKMNFIKSMVMRLAKEGNIEVPSSELDAMYSKWAGESVQETIMKRMGEERTGLKHGANVVLNKTLNEGKQLTGTVNHLHMHEGVGVNWGGNSKKLYLHKKEDISETA